MRMTKVLPDSYNFSARWIDNWVPKMRARFTVTLSIPPEPSRKDH
jgi:hypothetical protein